MNNKQVPKEMNTEELQYIANLRHILNLLRTASTNIVYLQSVDKRSEESIKEAKQDIEKAITAIEGELRRYAIKEQL